MEEKKKRGRPAKAVEPVKETAIAIQEQPKQELVLQGDPEAQLAFAIKAANALMKAVAQKAKPVMIRGEQYLEYGDWQTLARFFGATAGIEWTKELADKNGYEARATVLHQGQIISSAEAMCTRDERNWKDRDEFMLRSMAQTRAAAKALRNAYGWVAELAGMKSTPAEEMDGVREPMQSYQVKRVIPASDDEAGGAVIQDEYPDDKQFLTKKEIAVVDEDKLKGKSDQIKDLLASLGKTPTTRKSAEFDVKLLTGIFWKLGQNDDEIISALREKLEATDPIEKLGAVIQA